MGKLTCKIKLDKPDSIYDAGQLIKGNVIINLSKPTKVKGISLMLYGEASVFITNRTDNLHASEDYTTIDVLSLGNGKDSTVYPAGNSVYPFQYQLPADLPSSFVGKYGFVDYEFECSIKRPRMSDHIAHWFFDVRGQLDLNQVPDVLGERIKTLHCLWCASGHIEVTVRLNRTGYTPGEDIIIDAEIANNSRRKVKSSKAELIQKRLFHAKGFTKDTSEVVAIIKRGAIKAGKTVSWRAKKMRIPPLPPSGFPGCEIIDIEYTLKFSVAPSVTPCDIKIPLKVVIGTIPLQAAAQGVKEQTTEQSSNGPNYQYYDWNASAFAKPSQYNAD